jgi:hypothetical protein
VFADDLQQREADEQTNDDDLDDLAVGDDEIEDDEVTTAADDDVDDDVVVPIDADELEQASLEQLRDQRTARKRLELDEDEDLMALVSEAEEPVAEPLLPRVTPIKNRQEFVCARCHLVKPRVQLADSARGLCRDCA